jgi:uncharacterized protein YndB with AHSA1/START domain
MKFTLIWIPLMLMAIGSIAGSSVMSAQFIALTAHKAALILANPTAETTINQKPADISEATTLKNAIKQWISALTQEEGFEAWKDARWESTPVGPGTHSWLVVIRKNQVEVGYLIVGAIENSEHYKLIEYGPGPQPLFSLNTLYQSLMQQELIDSSTSLSAFSQDASWSKERFYLNAMESFWRITHHAAVYYLDAKTGEMLLNLADQFAQQIRPMPSTKSNSIDHSAFQDELTEISSAEISRSNVMTSFDPFDKPSWIINKPISVNTLSDLILAFSPVNNTTYMSRLYQRKVIFAFAAIGYQQWHDGQAFIILDDKGKRYVPLAALLKAGSFYQ